ncbi:MAG: zinc ABC transporter substrate-binding protein [Fervidicoccaceae archaeon]
MKSGLIFLILLSLFLLVPSTLTSSGQGEKIVVTFPILQGDVERIVNGSIEVVSLVKPGVDPHDYQLSPSDAESLKSSSLIISTLHTYMENQIDSMIKSGEIKAKYLVIPQINGIQYEINPNNGIWNPHMPVYDPRNYLLFIANLTQTLDEMYPNMSAVFNAEYNKVRQQINQLLSEYEGRASGYAVASSPEVQYAVEWTGIKIVRFVLVDEDVGVQPKDINAVEEYLSNGTAKYAIVAATYSQSTGSWTPYSNVDATLVNLAQKYGAKIIYVPTTSGNLSILDSLQLITKEIFSSGGETATVSGSGDIAAYYIPIVMVILIVMVGIILYRRGKH